MTCLTCKGSTSPGVANHFIDQDDAQLVVTGVPAEICDQCGEVYLTGDTAEALEHIAAAAAAGRVTSESSVPKVAFAEVSATAK